MQITTHFSHAVVAAEPESGAAAAGDPVTADAEIARALSSRDESDARLAELLFEFHEKQYFRVLGYRSVPDYLRGRFSSDDVREPTARFAAKSFHRFVRAHRVAKQIPLFAEYFNKIPRSKRWLISAILTEENAREWIDLALGPMTVRELEQRIQEQGRQAQTVEERVRISVRMFPAQVAIYERALAVARRALEQDGKEPGQDGDLVELLAAEFLATYPDEGPVGYLGRECPACGLGARLERLRAEDVAIDGRLLVRLRCARCRAELVVTTVGGAHGHETTPDGPRGGDGAEGVEGDGAGDGAGGSGADLE